MQSFVILSVAEASEAIAQYLAAAGRPAAVSSFDILADGEGISILCGLDGFKPDEQVIGELEFLDSTAIPIPPELDPGDERNALTFN